MAGQGWGEKGISLCGRLLGNAIGVGTAVRCKEEWQWKEKADDGRNIARENRWGMGDAFLVEEGRIKRNGRKGGLNRNTLPTHSIFLIPIFLFLPRRCLSDEI